MSQDMEAAREAARAKYHEDREHKISMPMLDIAFDAGFDAGWNARQPKPCVWTPVSEGLPDKDGQYFITVPHRNKRKYVVMVGWKYGDGWAVSWNDAFYSEPIAWMPLPEPYCGGKIEESE